MPHFVDLSVPIETTDWADPPGMAPRVDYTAHNDSPERLLSFFPGLRRRSIAWRGGVGDGARGAIDPITAPMWTRRTTITRP